MPHTGEPAGQGIAEHGAAGRRGSARLTGDDRRFGARTQPDADRPCEGQRRCHACQAAHRLSQLGEADPEGRLYLGLH